MTSVRRAADSCVDIVVDRRTAGPGSEVGSVRMVGGRAARVAATLIIAVAITGKTCCFHISHLQSYAITVPHNIFTTNSLEIHSK